MATKFNMTRDINGFNGFGLPFSDTNFNTILSANAEQHFTVPAVSAMGGNGIYTSSTWIAVIVVDPGSSVWVANNSTAAVPSSSFETTLSQLNPPARLVHGGDVLSFITADTTVEIGVELYALT